MKRFFIYLLALIAIGLAGCEIDADEDIRVGDEVEQVEVTVQQ